MDEFAVPTVFLELYGEAESLLLLLAKLSNMFPKPSRSESPNDSSPSNNLGGVAVLAELAVIALSLLPGIKVVLWVVIGDERG
jgi:hypothetical protein